MTAKNPSPSPAPSVINTEDEITDTELDKVSGGKVNVHDISITKLVDKASPVLMLA
jgi:bacteriocin-like protein